VFSKMGLIFWKRDQKKKKKEKKKKIIATTWREGRVIQLAGLSSPEDFIEQHIEKGRRFPNEGGEKFGGEKNR